MRTIFACMLLLMSAESVRSALLIPAPQNREFVRPGATQDRGEMTTDPEYGQNQGTADLDSTGTYGGGTTGASDGASGDTDSLPDTASELPLVGWLGMLALSLAIGFRIYLRKN
jgi:hypothetical protein